MSGLGRRGWWLAGGGAFVGLWLVVLALVAVLKLPDGDGGGGGETAPAADSADAGFARDMAVHHQQAVEMSFVVRDRTDDEEVRRLAFDIINTQANQRGMLLGRLELWDLPKTAREPMAWMGHDGGGDHDGALMPGMATKAEMDELRKAKGEDAEVRFLELMTDHHEGGVDMAQGAVKLADDERLVRLAKGMVKGQRSEMRLMASMLEDRGA